MEELLLSLSVQTESAFDVIIVEDGSQLRSDAVAKSYDDKLQIKYFYKENSGPGLSRNYGCEKSQSGFFVFFDSDCVVPPTYIADLKQHLQDLDAFGGPDRSHASFTPVQKAISYSMTSLFTTGGIRGNKKSVEKFHPRSFNMGFTREVFEKTGGFSSMRFGEDIDLSIRIVAQGFSSKLIPECFVFHKRRTDFRKFFKQVFNSGIARINLYKRHPQSLRLLHFFPSAFVIYQFLSIPHALYHQQLWVLYPTVAYLLLLLTDALKTEKKPAIALLSVWAAMVQLFGYGLGFIKSFIKRIILGQSEFHAYDKTFYK